MAGPVPGGNTALHDQSGPDRPCPHNEPSAAVDLSTPAPPPALGSTCLPGAGPGRSDDHCDVLDQGPNEQGIAILAFAFLVVQVSLTAVGLALGLASTGYSSQRLSLRHLPSLDRWSLLRLLLAVAFVAVGAYATADADSAPLAPLYIPVIGVAAAIGAGEGLLVLIVVAIARLGLPVDGPAQAAVVTEQGLVLGVVGVILAVGTRRTVSSLGLALDRLRTMNATERRRNRQLAGLDAVGRTLAANGPEPCSLRAVMDLLTGPFGYSHGSIYLGEALGGSPTSLRIGAQHGYDVPIPVFDGTLGVIGRVIRTGQPALVPDVLADPDYVGAAAGLRSEICVPLVAADELLGIVNVERRSVTRSPARSTGATSNRASSG